MINKRLRNGLEIPALGIGTYEMGGTNYKPCHDRDEQSIKAIQDAINLGFTHIDTAEKYGGGHTEELIGEAIKEFDRRRLFITTKVDEYHLKFNDVIESAKNSLVRLGTKYVDLYLIHAPNPDIPLEETMEAMDYLFEAGLIKSMGVSNFNAEEIREAEKYTKNCIVANQLKYNPWSKGIDRGSIGYCQREDIEVIAHTPLGRGKLSTQKIGPLSDMSKKYSKTEAQIILNWLVSKENVVAIFKAENTDHLKENLKSLDFKMFEEDLKIIDELVALNNPE